MLSPTRPRGRTSSSNNTDRRLALLAAVLLALPGAHAQTVWDPAFTTTGSDGAGIWSAAAANWASSGSDTLWPNNFTTIATFGSAGSAGVVTVSSGIKANGLIFNPVSTGQYTLSGGILMLGGSLPTIDTEANADITASLDGGSTTLFKTGNGTLTLDGATTNLPSVKVVLGTLATTVGGAGSFGNSATSINVSFGGAIQTTGAITVANPFTFNGGSGNAAIIGGATLSGPITLFSGDTSFNTLSAATLSGNVTGAGNLTKTGSQKLILTGTNSYTGTTTISNGTLQVGNGGTTGSLGTGPVVDDLALSFDRSDSFTVANAISGPGTLVKSGAGKLILTGASNYTGNTTVSSGTLEIDGPITGASNSQIIVATGATLAGNGSYLGATSGAVTLLTGAKLSPGAAGTIGTLSMNSLSWTSDNATASMFFDLSNTDSTSDMVSMTGSFSRAATSGSYIFDFDDSGLAGDTYTLLKFGSTSSTSATNLMATDLPAGDTATFSLTSTSLTVHLVPEPSTSFAAIFGGLCLLLQRQRRRI
ncbi:MAG TPA: autotransporter-associated beta strand repeat-containing protein [Chthoniobacteraceae bacterium]